MATASPGCARRFDTRAANSRNRMVCYRHWPLTPPAFPSRREFRSPLAGRGREDFSCPAAAVVARATAAPPRRFGDATARVGGGVSLPRHHYRFATRRASHASRLTATPAHGGLLRAAFASTRALRPTFFSVALPSAWRQASSAGDGLGSAHVTLGMGNSAASGAGGSPAPRRGSTNDRDQYSGSTTGGSGRGPAPPGCADARGR